MKILHIVTGLASGGAERQLQLLLRYLPEHQQCEVATLTNPGSVATALRAAGVTVHDLRMDGNRDIGVIPRLTRLIRDGGYDLVHTHLYRAMLYGRLAARLAGVRAVVATEHSLHPTWIEGRPVTPGVKALYLAAEKLGTTTIAVSRQVAATLTDWGVPQHRIELLPNGIERPCPPPGTRQHVRTELALPQGAFVIGAVGRLVSTKRFGVLVDALAELRALAAEHPALREPWLLLVGAGPELTALERQAERLGVRDRLRFTGERDDVPELLTAMDVLAAPSAGETFGLTVLEGLAAGLPVRYSACPALDDFSAADDWRAASRPDSSLPQPSAGGTPTDGLSSVARSSAAPPSSAPPRLGSRPSPSLRPGGPPSSPTPQSPEALGSTPAAVRVPSEPAAYTAALCELWSKPSDPLPPPPAVAHYDIARIAGELGRLYDRLCPAQARIPAAAHTL